jgi:hypothetical protein
VIRGVIAWWRRRRWSHPEIDRVHYYATQSEVPDDLPEKTIAVVGSADLPKWAILDCPCRRGHRLTVNLSRKQRPYWQLTLDAGMPSLYPSIDYDDGHRCHFWLRRGRVYWVPRFFIRP